MIDHVSISVKDYQNSLIFYDATLSILGYKRSLTINIEEFNVQTAGYGVNEKPYFWISPMGLESEEIGRAKGLHIAFTAPDIESVNKWHKKCLELGATDNGAPGYRTEYHPGYYAAFIIDPNGWRIEAVFHKF